MTKLERLKENTKPFRKEKEKVMKKNIDEYLKYDKEEKRGVLYRDKDGNWILTNKVDKLCHDKICIQNDNYVNIRKAIADGYVIKYTCGEKNEKEIDEYAWDPTRRFYLVPECYKITKQKRFQPGDWFVFVADTKSLMMVTEINEYNSNCSRRDGDAVKWEPKNGEWCVFWNDDSKQEFIIAKCSSKGFNFAEGHNNCWDNVAPLDFVEYLKEDK